MQTTLPSTNLYELAYQCLCIDDPVEKCQMTAQVAQAWQAGQCDVRGTSAAQALVLPGRPERPPLVPPREVPKRKLATTAGRVTLVHALAHIEFNAINLAWDAVYRFRELPEAYYDDWVQVAAEEAYHFQLLCQRLQELGHAYGDFAAHNGLWEMALKTAHDPLLRMALVPRVLEARGLDVTPGMMERLRQVGDSRTVAILEIILRDEIGHVAIGSRWYRYLCEQRGIEPEATFARLLQEHMGGFLRGPFHDDARRAAGFSESELHAIKAVNK